MAEDDDDVRTGSGRQRWDRDRKLAMETALNYAKGLGLSIECLDTRHLLLLWHNLPQKWANKDAKYGLFECSTTRGTPTRSRFSEGFWPLAKDSSKTDFKLRKRFRAFQRSIKIVEKYLNMFHCTPKHFSSFQRRKTPRQKWYHRYTDNYIIIIISI